jgi:glycosyltransferase involved in cell wall biosynthesis
LKISVILPVRNAEGTIARSVESVLSQTYEDFELTCIINDSSDGTEKILIDFAKRDSRVKIFHSSAGLVPALNFGLSVAKHDIIARQDADDLWYPEKLEKQVKFLKKNPEIDIIGVQIRSVDEKFEETRQEPKRPTKDLQIKSALLSGWNVIPHPGVVFRKRIMEKLGGYDDTFPFAEDYSLWLRAIRWYSFGIIDEVLLDYTSKHNPGYNHQVPAFLCSVFKKFYGV